MQLPFFFGATEFREWTMKAPFPWFGGKSGWMAAKEFCSQKLKQTIKQQSDGIMGRKQQAATLTPPEIETPELHLTCSPIEVASLIRTDHGDILSTKLLAIFYALADTIGKTIDGLKDKCRPLIVARRNEGSPSGEQKQHREFLYQIPAGQVRLIVQERMIQQIDREKLADLLTRKNLWQVASSIDLEKVNGLRESGLIAAEEFATVITGQPQPKYALIARVTPKEQAGHE